MDKRTVYFITRDFEEGNPIPELINDSYKIVKPKPQFGSGTKKDVEIHYNTGFILTLGHDFYQKGKKEGGLYVGKITEWKELSATLEWPEYGYSIGRVSFKTRGKVKIPAQKMRSHLLKTLNLDVTYSEIFTPLTIK